MCTTLGVMSRSAFRPVQWPSLPPWSWETDVAGHAFPKQLR